MKKSVIATWAALPLLLGASAATSGDSWSCRKANLTREVIIIYPESPARLPCSVFYAKPNEDVVPRTLWEASHTEGYCESKADAFVGKLESWGWGCERTLLMQPAGD